MWLAISKELAIGVSCLLSFGYVASLYIWRSWVGLRRDDPRVATRRIMSVLVFTIIALMTMAVFLRFDSSATGPSTLFRDQLPDGPSIWEWYGIKSSGFLLAIVAPVALFMCLFAGPLVVEVLDMVVDDEGKVDLKALKATTLVPTNPIAYFGKDMQESMELVQDSFARDHFVVETEHIDAAVSKDSQSFVAKLRRRAYVGEAPLALMQVRHAGILRIRDKLVSPICEEIVFRAVICGLLRAGGVSTTATLFASPALFGLAHVHHFWNLIHAQGVAKSAAFAGVFLQLCYTSLFGVISAFLYLRTGHLLAVIIMHCLCNFIGAPDFSFLRSSSPLHWLRYGIAVAYVLGLVAFMTALGPLTNPSLYDCGLW